MRRILRINQIVGAPKANPPIEPKVPVSKATWYRGIARGIYPKPTRISEGSVGWWEDEVDAAIEKLAEQ